MAKDRRKVFVIHGRDDRLRDSIFAFLRALGLNPIEWSQAVRATGNAAPFIGEVLEAAFAQAQAAVVVLSGDDMAYLRTDFQKDQDPQYEKQATPQARPNVLFEAGMAFGRHPSQTILVQVGTIRPFSDIAGRHIVRLGNAAPQRHELANRLQVAGCEVDASGQDWYTVGDFDVKEPPASAEPSLQKVQPKRRSLEKKDLDPDAIRILAAFLDIDYPTERTLKYGSGLTKIRFEYFLHELWEKDFVEYIGAERLNLTQKGRAFLVENGYV